MSGLLKTTVSSIMASALVGALLWWGVVEVRLAKAEVKIERVDKDIEEVKGSVQRDIKYLRDGLVVIDEKITRLLFVIGGNR